jgi:hypothetical protein
MEKERMNEKQVETFNKWMQFFKPIIPSEDGLTDNLEEQYAEQMIKRLIEDILKLSDNPLTSLKPLVDEYEKTRKEYFNNPTGKNAVINGDAINDLIARVIELVKEGV